MNQVHLLRAGLVACVWAAGWAALADEVPGHMQTRAALARAKLSLDQAVTAAVKSVELATLIRAELTRVDEDFAYSVRVLTGSAFTTVNVNAVSGQLRKGWAAGADIRDEDYVKLNRALAQLRLSPAEALELAAKSAGSAQPALLEVTVRDETPVYLVRSYAPDRIVTARVDGTNGKVLDVDVQRPPRSVATWNFDDKDAAGTLPAGWSARQTAASRASAEWEIVADDEAPSAPHVLAVVPRRSGDQAPNLAVAEWIWLRDVELTVRVRADSGREAQGGGPVWRCQDEQNYYACRFNPLENNFRVYKVSAGEHKQLLSAPAQTEAGRWYTVRVRMTDDRITCALDGERLLEVKDDTFSGPGMIGLCTPADAETSFDDLAVTDLVRP